MIGVSVKGADEVARRLGRVPQDLHTAQERGVLRGSLLVQRDLRLEMTAPANTHPFWGRIGASGDGLSVRSGSTRASVQGGGRVYRYGNTVTAAVGSTQKHLKDHEEGGTFAGKSPKGYARIPTALSQTAAGVDRNAGRSIRDIDGAFLLRTKSGRLWAAREAGGKGSRRLELLYLLVKSVRLKPRHIFKRVADASRAQVQALVGNEVSLVVGRANG